jgi:hypothetical protein
MPAQRHFRRLSGFVDDKNVMFSSCLRRGGASRIASTICRTHLLAIPEIEDIYEMGSDFASRIGGVILPASAGSGP